MVLSSVVGGPIWKSAPGAVPPIDRSALLRSCWSEYIRRGGHGEFGGYNLGVDIRTYNRVAWDHQVAKGDRWTVPVSSVAIERARRGEFELLLTPSRPVPRDWFPPLRGMPTLCLASGGGQQGPLLAAAGAQGTALDNSPPQLAQDRLVADREGLTIEMVEGDMADLSMFSDERFGLIVHACSNCFVPDVRSVWRGWFFVFLPRGVLFCGFFNSLCFP